MDDRARRDAGEDPFLVEQQAQTRDRVVVGDEELAVDLRDVEDRRHVTVLERAEAHDGVARQRLGGRDDDVGEALAQPRARAHERAAGAEPGDEDVDAVERRRDLGARALVVGARVRLVRVLERHEVARFPLGELEREADATVRALGARRLDDLRAVEPQQLPAFLRRVLGQDARERIALELRDERERDAGVAGRRLEELAAGFELARRLRRLDHREGDAILRRPGRVLPLELRVETHRRFRREVG